MPEGSYSRAMRRTCPIGVDLVTMGAESDRGRVEKPFLAGLLE